MFFAVDLFSEERDEFGFDVEVSCGEAFFVVDSADDGLHAGWVSEAAEEFVGCEVGKPDSIHAASFPEDKFPGKEGEHGIADPCCLTFDL